MDLLTHEAPLMITDETLEVAIIILRGGMMLPLDLAADLFDRGYDVTAIERKYAA